MLAGWIGADGLGMKQLTLAIAVRRRDRQRRDPAGCGDDPHPLSRLDTLAWRRRADSGGSSGGYDPRIAAATSSSK